jgi:hypothetical protein
MLSFAKGASAHPANTSAVLSPMSKTGRMPETAGFEPLGHSPVKGRK